MLETENIFLTKYLHSSIGENFFDENFLYTLFFIKKNLWNFCPGASIVLNPKIFDIKTYLGDWCNIITWLAPKDLAKLSALNIFR